MNKTKKIMQGALTLGVIIVGIYMLVNHAWPTPPAISGVGFLLAGLALWVPRCPIIHMLVGGNKHSTATADDSTS